MDHRNNESVVVKCHIFITCRLDGNGLPSSRSGYFTSCKRICGVNRIKFHAHALLISTPDKTQLSVSHFHRFIPAKVIQSALMVEIGANPRNFADLNLTT
jgi:hypothetical protein